MDTTELDFPTHEAGKHGFGNCGNGPHPDLLLHPILAVDADKGGVIGLLDCAVINRTEGKGADHKPRGADAKESRRWLQGAERAADGLADAAMITVVGERESDIYDLFARRPANVHRLRRSAQARAVTAGAWRGAARTGAQHNRWAREGQTVRPPGDGRPSIWRGQPEAPLGAKEDGGNQDRRPAQSHRPLGRRCPGNQPARMGRTCALAVVDHAHRHDAGAGPSDRPLVPPALDH
jgi:hypothetical protein